jgi:hypothetical protein
MSRKHSEFLNLQVKIKLKVKLICTFSFEIEESSLSDTRCCIAKLHGDKRMA